METSRQTRDRKGGHKTAKELNGASAYIGVSGYTPVERSLIKRLSKKKVRRQFNRSMSHIQRELENDYTTEEFLMDLELDEMYGDDWHDDEWRLELEPAQEAAFMYEDDYWRDDYPLFGELDDDWYETEY